jgi:hypothetical protein
VYIVCYCKLTVNSGKENLFRYFAENIAKNLEIPFETAKFNDLKKSKIAQNA